MNKKVAKVASDMLMMLCDHTDRLLDYHPHMPKKITEVGTTLTTCWTATYTCQKKKIHGARYHIDHALDIHPYAKEIMEVGTTLTTC